MSAVRSPLPPSSSCLDSYLGADGRSFLSGLVLPRPNRGQAPYDRSLEVQGTFSSQFFFFSLTLCNHLRVSWGQ